MTYEPHATLYRHAFAHYDCKLVQHSIRDWVELIKPESVLIIGDSVLRDPFCLILYKNLVGEGKIDKQCRWSDSAEYHTSNKLLSYERADEGKSKINFHWNPQGDPERLEEFLKQLASPPTHVYLSIALWLAKMDVEDYLVTMKVFLHTLESSVPETTKIVLRSSAGVVQQIQCYDRIGGQRFRLERMNAGLQLLVKDQFPRIQYMNLYPLFDAQPGSSPDGRHWGAQGHTYDARPSIGIVEHQAFQALFHHWWRADVEMRASQAAQALS
ncbi:hypothetical protein OIO90_001540 [Microbotryomycetes sp. JL221]|nr:hypothetical protein OIO90_001540 [Microbotryomycetes sp. JL221]